MGRVLENWPGGISEIDRKLSNPRYAGDIILIAATKEAMVLLSRRRALDEESKRLG